jgi:hypothetical protein
VVTTYTAADVTSIDAAATYSDAGLTSLIETLTHGNFAKIATGVYQNTDEFTYASYAVGTTYYLKITWTPSGGSQRTDSFPFLIMPQGQAAGAADVTTTDFDGAHLQAPQVSLRLGRGGYRESDFENYTTAALHRFLQELILPPSVLSEDVHLLVSATRAGAPLAWEFITGHGEFIDSWDGGRKTQQIAVPVPIGRGSEGGYRSSAYSTQHFLKHSRNVSLEGDVPRTRKGFKVQRQIANAIATYTERLPLDKSDGTLVAAILHKDNIYTDAATPAAFATTWGHSTFTAPYGANTNKIPQHIHIRGRTIVVNGTDADFRVVHNDGSNKAKPHLDDPDTPTISLQASGSMTADVLTYVRVQYKDNDLGTISGPSQRTATATSTTPTGANLAIRVIPQNVPARATHWRVATATTDTPASFSTHLVVNDTLGGSDVAGADGWIAVSETDGFIEADPTGDAFPFRSVDGTAVYQHSNPPTGATHIAHYAGRAIYASDSDTWLVLSESTNPEHFYNDPSSPHDGFNTFRGESLVDAAISPCTALAATETQVLFFMRSGLVVYEGSLVLDVASSDSTAQIRGRDARARVVTQDSLGAISPSVQIVDHDAYLFTQRGPGIYSGAGIRPLMPEAIEDDWAGRDPVFEHRYVVGVDPDRGQVHFSFVTGSASIAGVPDKTLAFNTGKSQWCPPWDLHVCSWTLHRLVDADSSAARGTRLMFGGPYGSVNEFGYGFGDGEDGSDTDAADLTSTSDTTTTVDVSGKSWTNDEWKGNGLCLTDRTTGQVYYRTIKTNDADTLTWEGAQADSGGGWLIHIGGIRTQGQVMQGLPGKSLKIQKLQIQLQDQISRSTT